MADAWKTFGITISVLIVLSLITYAFVYISRECNNNLDCPQNNYCAFNHKCYPLQQVKTVEKDSSFYVFIISILSILILSYFYYKALNKRTNP